VPTSYGQLFRNRNYFRVFTAGLGSTAGQAITGVCLVWVVFTETDSALDVAFLGTGFLLSAILFSTIGGTLVDRYDRRRLMITADVARGVAMFVVVLVLAFHGFNLPVLIGAYATVGAFTVLFNPAEQAIVPALVSGDSVADANGLVRSSRAALQFLGASVAGVLIVTVGAVWGIGINVATFALSAALLTGMRVPASPVVPGPPVAKPSYFTDLRAGFAWLWQAQAFFQLTMSAMFFNFSANLIATFIVVYSTLVLHGSAIVFASLLAAEVAGSAIGALLVGRTGAVRYAGKAWVIPYGILSGVVALGLPLFPNVAAAIVIMLALGTFGGFAGTAWLTAAQLLVPTEMQGRYFGIDQLGSIAILPAAQIGGALLIAAYGVRETYLAAAVLWVLAGAAFLLPRAMWKLGVEPGVSPTLRSGAAGAGTSGSPAGTRGE
jgi:Transmembrane secretion effector